MKKLSLHVSKMITELLHTTVLMNFILATVAPFFVSYIERQQTLPKIELLSTRDFTRNADTTGLNKGAMIFSNTYR